MSQRETRRFVVHGFATTHDALAAEALLKARHFAVVPIPAPRELGSLCGIALRLEPHEAARAEEALLAGGIAWIARAEIDDV
jgi:hypothetical protein